MHNHDHIIIIAKHKILELPVKCCYAERGCTWRGTVSTVEEHAEKCGEQVGVLHETLMMTELQTPVDWEKPFFSLCSRRSIKELFPDPVGPMNIECANFLLIFPLLAMACSTALIKSSDSLPNLFPPTSSVSTHSIVNMMCACSAQVSL